MRRPIHAFAVLVMLAGCGGHQPTDVDGLSRVPSPTPPASALPTALGSTQPGRATPAGPGQWLPQPGPPPRALWAVADSEPMVVIDCDGERGRLKLAVEATGLPPDTRMLALQADSTHVDYPADPVSTTLREELVTHIALDAPILDRMLATPELTVIVGGQILRTGSPVAALAPVVAHCRARH